MIINEFIRANNHSFLFGIMNFDSCIRNKNLFKKTVERCIPIEIGCIFKKKKKKKKTFLNPNDLR